MLFIHKNNISNKRIKKITGNKYDFKLIYIYLFEFILVNNYKIIYLNIKLYLFNNFPFLISHLIKNLLNYKKN